MTRPRVFGGSPPDGPGLREYVEQLVRLVLGRTDVPSANYRYDSGWVACSASGYGSGQDFTHGMVDQQGTAIRPSRVQVWWFPGATAPGPSDLVVDLTGQGYLGLATLEVTASHTHDGPSHTHTGPSHAHTQLGHIHQGSDHKHTLPVHLHDSLNHTHGGGPTPSPNFTGNELAPLVAPAPTGPDIGFTGGSGLLTTELAGTGATGASGAAATSGASVATLPVVSGSWNGVLVRASQALVQLIYGTNAGPNNALTGWTNTGWVRVVAWV